MTPIELLKKILPKLTTLDGYYSLAGGLAASLYRSQPRVTNDLDFALSYRSTEQSKRNAVGILTDLGFRASMGSIADGSGRLAENIALVIGQHREHEY